MAAVTERSELRAELERAGAAVLEAEGFAVGHRQLLLDFVDGSLQWYEPRPVRVPPSRLDDLARSADAGHVDG